jgi:hypothetical protein
VSPNVVAAPERVPDPTTFGRRFRVRGPLAPEAVVAAKPGTTFVRTSFDHRSRAFLEVGDEGYLVRYEGFRKTPWEWAEALDVRRAFPASAGETACRYFNSLALSPGYVGPARLEVESDAG